MFDETMGLAAHRCFLLTKIFLPNTNKYLVERSIETTAGICPTALVVLDLVSF